MFRKNASTVLRKRHVILRKNLFLFLCLSAGILESWGAKMQRGSFFQQGTHVEPTWSVRAKPLKVINSTYCTTQHYILGYAKVYSLLCLGVWFIKNLNNLILVMISLKEPVHPKLKIDIINSPLLFWLSLAGQKYFKHSLIIFLCVLHKK